jgi:hypothetical protein
MKCVLCGRAMREAFAYLAGYPIGPKCAKRKGLVPHKPVKSEAVRVDERQLTLFDSR